MTDFYGRHVEGAATGLGIINDGTARVSVHPVLSKNLWVTKIGGRIGKFTSTNANTRMFFGDVDSSRKPAGRIAQTVQATLGTLMNSGGGGSVVTLAVEGATAYKAAKNKRFYIGATADLATVAFGMTAAADISYEDEYFYTKGGVVGTTAPTSMSGYSADYEGVMHFWLEGDYNKPPEKPTSVSPTGSISEVAPTITALFRDLNGAYGPGNGGANVGDKLNQVRVVVKRQSDGVTMWNHKYNATSGEIAANQVSIVYAGTALVRGTTYTLQIQVSDQFGEWSDYSTTVTFTPQSAGSVLFDTGDYPNGVIDTNTPTWDFRWTHATGLAADRVQLQLYSGSTLIEQTPEKTLSPTVASSAAPGTLRTLTWAHMGFAPLIWGANYSYRARARDTNGVWSGWSELRSFKVNSPPNIPSNMSPAPGSIRTSLPFNVTVTMTDNDDTAADGLTAIVRVRTSPNVDNPAMNGNVTGWALHSATAGLTYTGPTYDAAQNVTGSAGGSLKVNITGGAVIGRQMIVKTSERWGCVPGQSYAVQASVRSDNTGLHPVPGILFTDQAGTQLSIVTFDTATPITANTWTDRSLTGVVAPANAYWMHLVLVTHLASAVTGNVWFDEASFQGVSVRRHIAATLISGSATRWAASVTSDDIVENDTVHLNATGYDGKVYSGGVTDILLASWSTTHSITYAVGPSVEIDAPADGSTLTSAGLTASWTAAAQAQYLLQVRDSSTNAIVFQTNNGAWSVDAVTKSVDIPAAYLRNGSSYELTVRVKDSGGLEGSDSHTFTVSYTAPAAPSGLVWEAIPVGGDEFPTSIRLDWAQNTDPDFYEYIVYRSDLTRPLIRIQTAEDSAFIDMTPLSAEEYVYSVTVVTLVGVDYVESDPAEVFASVALQGAVLSDVVDGEAYRMDFVYQEQREFTPNVLESVRYPLSGGPPITIRRASKWWTGTATFFFIPDAFSTGVEKRDRFIRMIEEGGPTFCYRDEERFKMFVTLTNPTIYSDDFDVYQVRVQMREEKFTEGVD